MMEFLNNPFLKRKIFWFKDFLKGSPLWAQFMDVSYMADNKNVIPGGGKRRSILLEKILDFTVNTIPYYKGLNYSKLSDFPIINKQKILEKYSDFCAPIDKIPGQKGILHRQKTSGSTGTPFEVPQDTRNRIRRIATIKYENEQIGFHSFEPMMHLRAISHYWSDGTKERFDKNLNIWYVDNANLTDIRVKEILQIIIDNKIKVVRGYMTTLDTLTRYAVENNIKLSNEITFISVGELLLESLRYRVAEVLGCKIVSQYGNEENGVFGQSEINGPGNSINLNCANCFIEILKLDSDEPASIGEVGRIVVTDFTNYALPMIRYEIGDLGAPGKILEDGAISRIDKLSGRKNDMILRTDGSAFDLFNSFPKEIFNNPGIRQYQFIQHTKNHYTLKLSVKDKTTFKESDSFKLLLCKMLGEGAQLQVELVDELPVLNSGKR